MRPAPEFHANRLDRTVGILLVEDDAAFAALVASHLERVSWAQIELQCVDTLAAALARLTDGNFDLVIADLDVPDSSGLETIEALARASDRLVLALTGDAEATLRETAIECGAYDLVGKDGLDREGLDRLVRLASLQAKAFRSLRESEARFRSLTELTSDFFWETDCLHRIVDVSHGVDHHPIVASPAGKARWEHPSIYPDAQGWARHKAVMDDHRPFRDFEFARIDVEGVERHLSISGEPVFSPEGDFVGYRGIGRDITARRKEERMVALEHTITRVLADNGDTGEAVGKVIRAICEIENWDGGRYFALDEATGLMRFHCSWHGGNARVGHFIAKSSGLDYARGEGLVGRAWESGDIEWASDPGSDPRLKHPQLARDAGLRTSFAFPVHFEGRVCGVLSMASTSAITPHGRFLKALAVIGSQLGQYLQRVRAEEVQRRFRAAIDASGDLVMLVDPAALRYVDANENACRTLGYTREEILAIGPRDVTAEPGDLAALYARLIAGEALPICEGIYRRKDGSTFPVELNRQAMGSAGKFLIVVVARATIERKRAEQILKLEHTVTRTLAEAESLSGGLQAVLREVCESEGWECGRYFRKDEAGLFRYAESWHVPGEAMERYVAYSREMAFPGGVGIVGRAGAGEPQWVEDVGADPRVVFKPMAVVHGMRGAFMFPVTSQGEVLGVLSFTSREVRQPDQRLLQAVRVIGSQVGQFLTRKRAEDALRRFRAALDGSADMVFLVDVKSLALLDFNDTACSYLGYTRTQMTGMRAGAVILDKCDRDIRESFAPLIANPGRADSVIRTYRRSDGRMFEAEVLRRVIESPSGSILVLNARDLTERHLAQERQALHARYQEKIAAFGESALGKHEATELIEDAARTVHEALRADAVLYLEPGQAPREVIVRGAAGEKVGAGTATYDDTHALGMVLEHGEMAVGGEGAPALPFPWNASFACAVMVPVQGERGVQGALCALSRRGSAFGPEERKFLATAASVLSAGLRRIHSEGRLAFLAQFDALTGLPNRALLSDRFSQMIVQARRHDRPLGVLFIDLDQFKVVNDTLGHAGGDDLLKETARRLESAVRPGDTVARISGDEFAIILADMAKAEDAALVAQKVIDRLSAALHVRDQEVFVTASIGIASFPVDGDDAETLLGAADAAMYRAKQSGRNSYQFFTPDINQRTRARAQLAVELRHALERGEFVLAYQPKFDLRTRRVCAAEALLRWRHPERGLVAPGDFIPVLEETGLIVAVGEWVLRQVCSDLVAWQAAGLEPLPLAVNLSARQFRQQDLDARILSIVSQSGVDPRLIELEITESQVMQDPEHARRMMKSLSERGIRIAIDDFGTGYSSLSYLTRFPLSALKIDRSFVADVLKDPADASIVRTIIDMAHTLGFIVVAEGVETAEQSEFLRRLGCEQAQGYFFARPMPESDLRALIASTAQAPVTA